MKYKALISFAGEISMCAGEVAEIEESKAKDLLECGYIEKVAEVKKTQNKGGK